MNNNWKHKDVYNLIGTDFSIEVVRWSYYPISNMDNKNENIWNLYVYVYPKHPAFSKYKDEDNAKRIPFHGGCTFYEIHKNPVTNDITSIQIGCDYNHYMDHTYSLMKHTPCQELFYEILLDMILNML